MVAPSFVPFSLTFPSRGPYRRAVIWTVIIASEYLVTRRRNLKDDMGHSTPHNHRSAKSSILIAGLALFAVLLTGCAVGPSKPTAAEAFESAQLAGTIVDYSIYLALYPDSEYAAAARELRDKRVRILRAKQAKAVLHANEETTAALKSYVVGITGYPEVAKRFVYSEASDSNRLLGVIKVLRYQVSDLAARASGYVLLGYQTREPSEVQMNVSSNALTGGDRTESYSESLVGAVIVCRLDFRGGILVSKEFPEAE